MKKYFHPSEGISQTPELLECPKSVLEYLKEKHKALKSFYRTPDGRHSEICSTIALEIAELFIQAGCRPDICVIRERVTEDGLVSWKKLVPVMFQGLVEWSAHIVCCYGGKVYDPLLSEPIPTEEYTLRIFGESIPVQVLFLERGR
ncbi:MAG: hypothetical protein AAB473_01860 [Patescibacteria group bacterium]|mgnify:CR=1 FL=1